MEDPNNPLTCASDETLLAKYTATRCQHAFAEFHQRHYDETLCFIRRRVSNTHDAEDLTQETFLSIHQYRTTYDPSQPARAWLLQIAMNHVRTFRRKAKTATDITIDTTIEDTMPDPSQPTPSTLLLRKDTSHTLRRMVARLPARERRTILDLYFSETPQNPIGSDNSRKHQHRQALRRLRRMAAWSPLRDVDVHGD